MHVAVKVIDLVEGARERQGEAEPVREIEQGGRVSGIEQEREIELHTCKAKGLAAMRSL